MYHGDPKPKQEKPPHIPNGYSKPLEVHIVPCDRLRCDICSSINHATPWEHQRLYWEQRGLDVRLPWMVAEESRRYWWFVGNSDDFKRWGGDSVPLTSTKHAWRGRWGWFGRVLGWFRRLLFRPKLSDGSVEETMRVCEHLKPDSEGIVIRAGTLTVLCKDCGGCRPASLPSEAKDGKL